jgi:hypothetical protein
MDKMHNQISNIEFIGTDKIGFIVTAKIASSTLDGIKEKYDFIHLKSLGEVSEDCIVIKLIRPENEKIFSGWLEDFRITLAEYTFGDRGQGIGDINGELLQSVKDNIKFFLTNPDYDEYLTAGGHRLSYEWITLLSFAQEWWFIDLKDLSDPRLIKWISKYDPRWKEVKIPFYSGVINRFGQIQGDSLPLLHPAGIKGKIVEYIEEIDKDLEYHFKEWFYGLRNINKLDTQIYYSYFRLSEFLKNNYLRFIDLNIFK